MKSLLVAAPLLAVAACSSDASVEENGPDPFFRVLRASSGGSSGLLLGTPVGVTSKFDGHIQIKLAGFDPGTPTTWPPAYPRPRFEHLVLSILMAFNKEVKASPILALSSGLDVIDARDHTIPAGGMLDGTALAKAEQVTLLDIPPPGWYAIQFAVQGGLLNQQKDDMSPDIRSAAIRGQVSRSIFSYALPGGTAVRLPGEVESVRCLAPENLGLAPNDEIHGLDFHAAMYHSNLMLFDEVFRPRHLPDELDVFFTLRDDFLKEVTPAEVKDKWKVKAADSGTIYVSTWKNGRWSTPTVYRTWLELGFKEPVGILDGLAIDSGDREPGKPSDPTDDEIMFSTGGQYEQLSVATQMQFVKYAAKNPEKKLVVQLTDGGYGSLGTRMRAGKAVGDFCTGDPWGIPADTMRAAVEAGKNTRAVAEREAPAEPQEVAAPLETESQEASTTLPNPVAAKYRDYLLRFHLPDDFFVARRYPLSNTARALTLAIAAYRQQAGGQPYMRGCMSWPGQTPPTGTAKLYWGHTTNIVGSPMPVIWQPAEDVPFTGNSLVFDKPLPNNGLLQDPVVSDPNPTAAYLMKWELRVGGTTYYSPVAALRY